MSDSGNFREKWSNFSAGAGSVLRRTGNVMGTVFSWMYRLRKILMAIPVLAVAIYLAVYNSIHLPEEVGLELLSNGQFRQMASRELAVFAPLGVTAVSLLLMLCSRRALHPWIISIFTLILPVLILLLNNYAV